MKKVETIYLIDDFIQDFMDIIKFLDGKKTYIIAGAVALVTFALAMGWVSQELANIIYGLLGAGGLFTMRSAIK